MRYVTYNDVLDEVKNEYDNIPIYEKKELFKWSLMNNHKEIYDIFLNDFELENLHHDYLEKTLKLRKYVSVYNMLIHKNFNINLNMNYYITILEQSYNNYMKLFEYVSNIDDIYDNITMKSVENFITFNDDNNISKCFKSDILIDRININNPKLLVKMKNIIISHRRRKLIKLKERIYEKQNT